MSSENTTVGEIDRDTLFKYVAVMPTHAVYSEYMSIFGRKKYMMFSKIPTKVLDNLNTNIKTKLSKCGKDLNLRNKSGNRKFIKKRK